MTEKKKKIVKKIVEGYVRFGDNVKEEVIGVGSINISHHVTLL